MPEELLRYELRERVALLHLDDGKANALSQRSIAALREGLERAEKEAGAALVIGRPGRFCGGFDLATMRAGTDAARDLVNAGGELFLRLLESRLPVAIACSGHAIAAGALMLLSADARVGALGDFKIGLNEVAIGMTLPGFAIELARQRVGRPHFVRATLGAELFAPEGAVAAGFLDRAVSPEALLETALEEAARLAALPQPAFGNTKRSAHAAAVAHIRQTLAADMRQLTGPT